MIRLDHRRGSGELERPLKRLGATVWKTQLPFADFAFRGNGPEGEERVGIERKRISDIVACIVDGRLSGHQLLGLLGIDPKTYTPLPRPYTKPFILVEGWIRPNPATGVLEECRVFEGRKPGVEIVKWFPMTRPSRLMYLALDGFISTLQEQAALPVVRTYSPLETCWWVYSRYTWWSKPWHAHKSLKPMMKVLHTRRREPTKDNKPEVLRLAKASTQRKMLAQIELVEWVRSGVIERHLGGFSDGLDTVMRMTTKDWLDVPGVGPKIAQQIMSVLHGRQR